MGLAAVKGTKEHCLTEKISKTSGVKRALNKLPHSQS